MRSSDVSGAPMRTARRSRSERSRIDAGCGRRFIAPASFYLLDIIVIINFSGVKKWQRRTFSDERELAVQHFRKIHSLARRKIFRKNLHRVFPRNLTGGISRRGTLLVTPPPRGLVQRERASAGCCNIPSALSLSTLPPSLPVLPLLFPRRKLQSPEAGRNAIKR